MIRYISLSEKRKLEYKAWYNPASDYFRQFDTNLLHSEISEYELQMSEVEAIKDGYYRIYMGHELNIDSWTLPDNQEFNATKYIIEANSYKKFKDTRWNVYPKSGYYYLPNQSFLYADSIKDAQFHKR